MAFFFCFRFLAFCRAASSVSPSHAMDYSGDMREKNKNKNAHLLSRCYRRLRRSDRVRRTGDDIILYYYNNHGDRPRVTHNIIITFINKNVTHSALGDAESFFLFRPFAYHCRFLLLLRFFFFFVYIYITYVAFSRTTSARRRATGHVRRNSECGFWRRHTRATRPRGVELSASAFPPPHSESNTIRT